MQTLTRYSIGVWYHRRAETLVSLRLSDSQTCPPRHPRHIYIYPSFSQTQLSLCKYILLCLILTVHPSILPFATPPSPAGHQTTSHNTHFRSLRNVHTDQVHSASLHIDSRNAGGICCTSSAYTQLSNVGFDDKQLPTYVVAA